MRGILISAFVAFALLWGSLLGMAATAPAREGARCGAEDGPSWNWVKCGNHKRGVVTMWGTPKVVTCGDLRWLVRHGDLDPETPHLAGDQLCR